jgi:hypothetical protein
MNCLRISLLAATLCLISSCAGTDSHVRRNADTLRAELEYADSTITDLQYALTLLCPCDKQEDPEWQEYCVPVWTQLSMTETYWTWHYDMAMLLSNFSSVEPGDRPDEIVPYCQ